MNVVLQLLFWTPEFRNTILMHGTSKDIPMQMQRLFLRMMARNGPVETTDLTTAFGWRNEQRQLWEEDPSEFFPGLLNLLIDQLPKTSAQFLRDSYIGTFSYTYKCADCKERKQITEDFRLITLPAYDNVFQNLEQLLHQMSAKEMIDRNCEKCGNSRSQVKIRIKSAPRILNVLFLRCCILPNGQRWKTNRRIGFSDFLTIPPTKSDAEKEEHWLKVSAKDEAIQERVNNGEDLYELISILLHVGTEKGGHYWAYIKNVEDNTWHSFNDSTVKQIEYDEIIKSFGDGTLAPNPNAQWLTYRRIKNCQNFARIMPHHIKKLQNDMQKEEGWLNDKKTHSKCEKCARIMLKDTYLYKHKECNVPVFKFSTTERADAQVAQNSFIPSNAESNSHQQVEVISHKDESIMMLNQNGTKLDLIKNFKRVFEFGQKGIAQLEQKMEEDEAKWIGENKKLIDGQKKLQLAINGTYEKIKDLAQCDNDANYLKEQLKMIELTLKEHISLIESSSSEEEMEESD